jgi:alpha-L-rhamnosidase
LTNVIGEIPHPNGKVAVAYALEKGKWKIKINIPVKTTGVLIWKNTKYPLKAGGNYFELQ